MELASFKAQAGMVEMHQVEEFRVPLSFMAASCGAIRPVVGEVETNHITLSTFELVYRDSAVMPGVAATSVQVTILW